MNHRMMLILVPVASLESPLNIDTKLSTNMPSVWLLLRHNDMCPYKNQEIWFTVQKYKEKIGFWLKILPKTHFDRFAKV